MTQVCSVFSQLLQLFSRGEFAQAVKKHSFRFNNKLMSLDGSIIDLSASTFDWAKYKRTKGAIKLHLLLDHDGYLPSFAVVTEGKHSEVAVARSLRLEAGTILVIDRGYNDFDWFAEMTQEGVFFVTRMKSNTVYAVEEECAVSEKGNVLRDLIISLRAITESGRGAGGVPAHRVLEPGETGNSGVLYQYAPSGGLHNCGHLQGPLASGIVFQGAEDRRSR